MGKIIVDNRYLKIAENKWGSKYEIIPSFTCENLQEPICAHPDMTIAPVGDIFVCCPESYVYYKHYLGDKVVSGATTLFSDYPKDIAYNVLIFENYAFGKEEYIDPTMKKELHCSGIKIINVNQGYAKCSACVAPEGVITADDTIYNALVKNSINTLKITPGHVKLSGYDYGFIGGASGIIDGVLTFFGDIRRHPDIAKIQDFCNFNFLDEFPLTDIGTIICI